MLAYVLTFGRIVLAGAFATCLAGFAGAGPLTGAAAGVLLALAAAEELTDIFDGMAARHAGTVTPLGGILDPLVDSLARLTIYFSLALAGWVSLAVPFVMAGRDIVVAYARIACAAAGVSTSARTSGKIKAVVQGAGILALILLASGAPREAASGPGGGGRTGVEVVLIAVTVWSLVDYVRAAWPAVRTMGRPGR
ncbi:MAG: CDP-alcohol phosphatidyltransferase family protein [Planctomycetota bacterium]|nr:CDP-alcohol phosphatidyltransferase family protein [Planctomycetota bacterium]